MGKIDLKSKEYKSYSKIKWIFTISQCKRKFINLLYKNKVSPIDQSKKKENQSKAKIKVKFRKTNLFLETNH